MCGRLHIKRADRAAFEAAEQLGLIPPPAFAARYNVAPTQDFPVILADPTGKAQVKTMRWGFWIKLKDSEKPQMQPNARAETAFTKFSFRYAVQQRRCLIPACGFFEWKKLDSAGKLKQPYEIHLKGERPFFFPAIYEEATALQPETFLLFTTRPNELVATIHDRMPAILTGAAARKWIEPGAITAEQFAAFTEPHEASDMEAGPVSSLVNSAANDVPEVLTPAVAGKIELEPAPLPRDQQRELGFS